MSFGPKKPSGHGGGGRRRRGRRGHGGRHGQHGKGSSSSRPQHDPIYTRPMDHSYRAVLGIDENGNSNGNSGTNRPRAGRAQHAPGMPYMQPDPEPVPVLDANPATRIFAFVDDLFFLAKIQEVARKLNVKVEFVKTDKDIFDRVNGDEKPSLVIFDLNNLNAKPLTLIPKLKSKLKKTSIIGFLSHVQGDLKLKAQEAGCDMVLPRSAFSQNLPQLLRRHGAPAEQEQLESGM